VRIFPAGGDIVASDSVAVGEGAGRDCVGSHFEMKSRSKVSVVRYLRYFTEMLLPTNGAFAIWPRVSSLSRKPKSSERWGFFPLRIENVIRWTNQRRAENLLPPGHPFLDGTNNHDSRALRSVKRAVACLGR
jgi:hypothetical protein